MKAFRCSGPVEDRRTDARSGVQIFAHDYSDSAAPSARSTAVTAGFLRKASAIPSIKASFLRSASTFGANLRLVRIVQIFCAQMPQQKPLFGNGVQQERANFQLVPTVAYHFDSIHNVLKTRCTMAVDKARHGPQRKVDADQEQRHEDGIEHLSRAGASAHGRRTPKRGGRIQPGDIAAILNDGARSEEADA